MVGLGRGALGHIKLDPYSSGSRFGISGRQSNVSSLGFRAWGLESSGLREFEASRFGALVFVCRVSGHGI